MAADDGAQQLYRVISLSYYSCKFTTQPFALVVRSSAADASFTMAGSMVQLELDDKDKESSNSGSSDDGEMSSTEN